MEKNNFADSWFNFKPIVGGRITSGARKHKLFNEVRLVIGNFELPLQFKNIEATNLVKRTIAQYLASIIRKKVCHMVGLETPDHKSISQMAEDQFEHF